MQVLFGHQSVGQNILEGIGELARQGRSVPALAGPDAIADAAAPIVVRHFRVGSNGNPLSKLEDFAGRASAAAGRTADVAMFKFCYVDLGDSQHVAPLFDAYVKTLNTLRRDRPGLVLAHVTVPLRAVPPAVVEAGMRLLGRRHPQVAQNAARHEFNERLRQRYLTLDPVFDLAALESGGRSAPPALQRRFTHDGGHLNEQGRQWVAGKFVEFLQQLASRQP